MEQLEGALTFSVFHNYPLWLMGGGLLSLLLVFEEAGYRVGLRRRQRDGLTDAELGGGGVVLNAIFALLGLILAFTYSSAVERHETRKQAVISEANALGTAFLRANVLPEPGRTELKRVLYEYAITRVSREGESSANRMLSGEERYAVIQHTLSYQARIWPATQRLVLSSPPGPGEVALMTAINEVLDVHTMRIAALFDKLPDAVVWMLLCITGAALGVAGFLAGIQGRMSRWRMVILAAVLSGVTMIIIDFDRPGDGLIMVPPLSLYSVIAEMRADLGVGPDPGQVE